MEKETSEGEMGEKDQTELIKFIKEVKENYLAAGKAK